MDKKVCPKMKNEKNFWNKNFHTTTPKKSLWSYSKSSLGISKPFWFIFSLLLIRNIFNS